MKHKSFFLPALLITLCFFFTVNVNAQTAVAPKVKTYRVGIFAPLYLDSMFSPAGYKYGKSLNKNLLPGVEFVQGALIALDSMQLWDGNVEAFVYDTRSYTQPLNTLIKSKDIDSLDLMIGSVKDIEFKELADFALLKNIPFISATYPNDGNITSNPFTAIMTSTLKSHCEAIYSYLLQSHGTDKLFLIRKKGAQEDKVAGYFKSLNEQDGKPLLNIQTINIDSSISYDFLKNKLDSNRQTVIIGASLDEGFANSLAYTCRDLNSTYPITLIGMPTWDGFNALRKKDEFENFPIYFTTAYFNNKTDYYSKMLTAAYSKKYKSKPSDMAFKGYEAAYYFLKLLVKYPNDLMSHLNDKTFKIFTDYNFRPVSLKKNSSVPDYFENKHLYFIKITNGSSSVAW
ncbi:MAG: ABC transporter substrate-binding protein [Ferruginibacter sp.]